MSPSSSWNQDEIQLMHSLHILPLRSQSWIFSRSHYYAGSTSSLHKSCYWLLSHFRCLLLRLKRQHLSSCRCCHRSFCRDLLLCKYLLLIWALHSNHDNLYRLRWSRQIQTEQIFLPLLDLTQQLQCHFHCLFYCESGLVIDGMGSVTRHCFMQLKFTASFRSKLAAVVTKMGN